MASKILSGNCALFYARHAISKKFSLDEDNNLVKEPGGQMYDAFCTVLDIRGPEKLAKHLNMMNPRQCMSWGVLTNGRTNANIAPKATATKDDVTRTRENFEFPSGTAIMMLDIDEVVTFDDLSTTLTSVVPDMAGAPHVFSHSASTYIYNGDDNSCVKGEGGKRVYVFVADGTDIPRAASVLGSRLKLAGHLNFKISKSGQLLERTLIDESVYQPERLDFCGGAECTAPLVQRRPPARAFNGDAQPLDTRSALPDLTRSELASLKNMLQEQRQNLQGQADQTRELFAKERTTEIVRLMGKKGDVCDPERVKEKIVRSIKDNILVDEMILYPESGGEVSAGEVRRNPGKWNGVKFADPVDPTYNNDKRIAMAVLRGGKPHIRSFAHGGQAYLFEQKPFGFEVDGGDYPRIVERCIDILAKDGRVYQYGGELVRLSEAESAVHPVSAPWLRNELEKLCSFTKTGSKGSIVPAQCPPEIVERILAMRGAWTMPVLKGVTSLPVMRLDGSIVHGFGYDEASQVYLTVGCEIPLSDIWKPKKALIKKALKKLYHPFRGFPFAAPMDRGVLLAALLTSAVRPSLPTAPGFIVVAPVFGSGKTLLAASVAMATGKAPCVMAWPDTVAEQRKALVSVLRGNPMNIILDNLTGSWNSTDLAAILTSDHFSDRVLGASEIIDVQTNCLVQATGNNVAVSGDLARRILVMTLDAGEERPDQRTFDFNPLDLVKADLVGFRCAALTVLRGYLTAKKRPLTKGGMGSFEDWERLVRQAVCWVAAEGLASVEIDDPLLSISKNFEGDNDTNRLKALLSHWHSLTDRPLTLKDLVILAEADKAEQSRSGEPLNDDESTDCLYDMLYEIAGKGNEVNTKMLAAWLKKYQKRVVDGMHIELCDKVKNIARWRVVCAEK